MKNKSNDHKTKGIKIRNVLLLTQGVIILILVGIIYIQALPKYTLLVNDIDEEQINLIISKLEANLIDYRSDEGSISVKEEDLTKAKMMLAVDLNIKVPDYSWTDVYADNSFTMTSDVREHQIMQTKAQAIARELESYVDWIESAKVEMYITPETDNDGDDRESSVSVMLRRSDDTMPTKEQISGIVQYLMNSIYDLPEENIVILDQTGTTLNRYE